MLDRAQVREVFAEAVALSEVERVRYLNIACAGKPELRAEVESLLSAASQRPAFLSSPTTGGSNASIAEPIGTRIGPYKLIKEIGQGGFGTVYLAEQQRPVERRVALKIIKLGMDTRAVIARFEAERQALAMMDHPNIARVLDAGATEAGRPYFVMELVKGEPITTYCDRNKLSIPERLGVFVQVCHAVQHAHSKGVIHRDIKPGNVLVATEDGLPHTKVIDFGIAKATQRSLTEKTVFTESSQFIGTPEYMAPEQADGSLNTDTRTDVYSLGVLLYELLTGATPFDSRALRAAAYGEIQRIICEVTPPKPSTRLSHAGTSAEVVQDRRTDSIRLSALVRGDLDWIVMRCMEKDRSFRYDTVEALAADVGRHLAGEPVIAAPPSKVYLVRKFVRRNRVIVAAGGAVFVTLILGIAGTSIGLVKAQAARGDAVKSATLADANAKKAREEAKRADDQAEKARSSVRVAEAVNELMKGMIGRADRAKEQGRVDVTVREVMDAAAVDLESGVTGMITREKRVVAMLAKSIGDTYSQLNVLDAAERMLRIHHQLTSEHFGGNSLESAASAVVLGEILRKRGSNDEARQLYVSARAIAGGFGDEGVEVFASTIVHEAYIDAKSGKESKAQADLRSVLDLLESKGLGGCESAVIATNNLAAMLWVAGKRDEAQEVYKRSLELLRKRGEQPDQADMLNNLAAIQHSQRDFVGAEKTSEEEVALVRRLYGGRHLTLARALDSYSMILGAREKRKESIDASREVVAIRRALLKPGHESLTASLRKLGAALIDDRQFEEAESVLREACEASARVMPAGDTDYVYARYQFAVALSERGKLEEAEAVLRVVLVDSRDTLKEGSRLWWMRGASSCLLAGVLARTAEKSVDAEDQLKRVEESDALINSNGELLLGTKEGMGLKTRRAVVGRSLDQVVLAREIAARLSPGPERESLVVEWRGKRERFLMEMAGK